MYIGIAEPAPTPGLVYWGLVFPLSVQKAIRKSCGTIDFIHSLEDVRYWTKHTEKYPKEFRRKTVYLWKTFDDGPRFYRILCLSWDRRTKTLLPYWFKLDAPPDAYTR